MLMRKKEEPEAKQAEDDEEDLQDNYKEDKPPEKTPEPTTKPIWRPPASRQQTKSLTENFPCDLRESWCELRMYVCSTGDDFLSERTAIMNALLPELQVRCASRRIRISAIDCWSSTGLNYFAVCAFFVHCAPPKQPHTSKAKFPSLLPFASKAQFFSKTSSHLPRHQKTPTTWIYSIVSEKSTAAQSSSRSAGGASGIPFPTTLSRQNCVCSRLTTCFFKSFSTQ